MRLSLRNGTIPLADGRLLAIRGARGVEVECTEGQVWLTVEGQAGDVLLSPGERSRIEGHGLALVEGLPAGAVRLIRPQNLLQRSWQALHRPKRPGAPDAPTGGRGEPAPRELPPVFG